MSDATAMSDILINAIPQGAFASFLLWQYIQQRKEAKELRLERKEEEKAIRDEYRKEVDTIRGRYDSVIADLNKERDLQLTSLNARLTKIETTIQILSSSLSDLSDMVMILSAQKRDRDKTA